MKYISVLADDVYGKDPQIRLACRYLGEAIAKRNKTLVFNGIAGGLIGEIATAVVEKNGEIVGFYNRQMKSKTIIFEDCPQEQIITVENNADQKRKILEKSDAIVLLPSGIASLQFFFEILFLNDSGLIAKPVALLNINNFFLSLMDYLANLVEKGFLKKELIQFILLNDNPWALLKMFDEQKTHFNR